MLPAYCDMAIGVYCDIMGQCLGAFYLLWLGYYHFYYKEIAHNISEENKEF